MTVLLETDLEQLAQTVLAAQKGIYEIEQLTAQQTLSEAEAYAVQRRVVAGRLAEAEGMRIIGLKTGLTSPAKQAAMGVHEPVYGYLLSTMLAFEFMSLKGLIHPRAEPELAFVLKRGLIGPGVSGATVLAATDEIRLAVEIIDSRYRNFSFGLADVIADNCSAGKLILSETGFSPYQHDLRLMGLTFEHNGELMYTGAGAAVMGHPANAVAWLVNKLWEVEGRGVEAGQVVLAGAFTPAVGVKPGDRIDAAFAGVGTLAVRFS